MDNFVLKPPRFPLGLPLNIGYLGLYYAAGRATNRGGREIQLGARIVGMRLVAEPVEGDTEIELVHREGWEYQVGYIKGQTTETRGTYHEYGWLREEELLKYGYGEIVPQPFSRIPA